MPWSSGTFSRSNGTHTGSTTWAQDAAAGTKITSSAHDTHDQDLADGINACLKKDGGNSATANIPMGGYKLTGMAVGSASTDSARYGQTITAVALDSGTNVLTLTRADGDLTVDLTAIVVGGSFGNLADKTASETITAQWFFREGLQCRNTKSIDFVTYVGGFVSATLLQMSYDLSSNSFSVGAPSAFPHLIIDGSTGVAKIASYTVWTAVNFNPDNKSDVTHTHTLDDLTGVYVPSPVDGDVLQWNEGSNAWTSTALASVVGVIRTLTPVAPIAISGTTDLTISCPAATTSVSGLMSAADKTKLDALSSTQVTTFAGRSGAVVATAGDYTIQQIGNFFVQNIQPSTSSPAGSIWVKNGSAGDGIFVLKSGAWQKVST